MFRPVTVVFHIILAQLHAAAHSSVLESNRSSAMADVAPFESCCRQVSYESGCLSALSHEIGVLFCSCFELPQKNLNKSNFCCRFDGFTGELLLQYKSVMKNAPEYFYTSLETKLKLDLVTTLKFAKALSTLAGTT